MMFLLQCPTAQGFMAFMLDGFSPAAWRFFQSPVAQAILGLVVVLLAVCVGIYVGGKLRGQSRKEQLTTHELLSNFRELHSRGQLNDSEYRTIRTMLAERLQQELKDSDDTG
ncbi:MAG: hypothetical protein ACYC35_19545 [Pirellulales bacterium]